MIIKGQSRGRYMQLARHLLRTEENESVRLYECRGTIAQSVEGALAEMEAHGRLGRSRLPLYHASISPDPRQPLSEAQLSTAADVLEEKLGFVGQPRIIVTHRKLGRDHAHVVWSRIDRTGKVISDSWNYAHHEEAARELEQLFGHERVEGIHRRTGDAPRPKRTAKEYELRQETRSGLRREAIQEELTTAWQASQTGEAFKEAIEAAGYRLVRGDRRGFVILDQAGEAHSLARCIKGVRVKDLTPKLAGINLATLPDVRAGRAALRARQRKRGGRHLMVASFSIQAGPVLRRLSLPSRRAKNAAADRAIIVSDFAAKIAAACACGSKDEITARVRRLREEEAAALAALKRQTDAGPSSSRMHLSRTFRVAARQVARRRKLSPPRGSLHQPAT